MSSMNIPQIWGAVPPRNKNFTGREELLSELRQRVISQPAALVPHALHGLGGVGKTQLAIEYAYRYAHEYQVVWWIPADQLGLIRSTLAALAPRLGLVGLAPGRVEDSMSAVLDALRRGKPYDRWLLIFDNADDPEPIRGLMPSGPGHVIVTSRNRRWESVVNAVEVDVFTRLESREFLVRRTPHIDDEEAERLAEALGELPLALEQAASLLAETAMTVHEYLDLLETETSRVLAERSVAADYSLPVAATWSLSEARIREQTPDAMELLQRCAFFGPTPISLKILEQARYVLGPPMREILSDRILMGRALRALGRYALARVDSSRQTIQVHRIIQRLIRDELDKDHKFKLRHEVHLLLAAAGPGDPEKVDNWPNYSDLVAHIGPSELMTCVSDDVRLLAQDIVRYLQLTGDYTEALALADQGVTEWSLDSNEDDKHVLIMARLKADALRGLGQYKESYVLSRKSLERMRLVLGDDHEETLILMNGYGLDLRARGDFAASLEVSRTSLERHRAVFGENHPRTVAAMNTLTEDLELNGDYLTAVRLNEQIYEEKLIIYRHHYHPLVLFTLGALARAMREEGRYNDAREVAQRAYDGFRQLVLEGVLADSHPWMLRQAMDLSVTLREFGTFGGALELARESYERCMGTFGVDHPSTMIAAVNLANALRRSGEIYKAKELLEATVPLYRSVFGADHPYTLGSILNLSLAHDAHEAGLAQHLLNGVLAGFIHRLGRNHHYTLICSANLTTILTELGESGLAVQLGEDTYAQLEALLGENHPHTLACALNLALDLNAVGRKQEEVEFASEALLRYREVLGKDHPDVRAAAEGRRLDFCFNPLPTF
jgi:tetratricopeptide (TPR) repeat protein